MGSHDEPVWEVALSALDVEAGRIALTAHLAAPIPSCYGRCTI
jgi:hypothetical protein